MFILCVTRNILQLSHKGRPVYCCVFRLCLSIYCENLTSQQKHCVQKVKSYVSVDGRLCLTAVF
jgi:hypothetical protein